MLAKALRTRALARLAVAALALGLFALAGLALWSTDRTERDTARLDEINEIAAKWGSLFEALNVQDAAMGDYLNAGDEVGRLPLESALNLGTRELDWLEQHSEPAALGDVALVADAYESYRVTLTDMVELGRRGDHRRLAQRGKAAALMADTLRKQLTANIAHRRLEIMQYLHDAKAFNHRLKVAGLGVFGVDVVLLLLCSAVLLSHQRRVERQAAESGHRALHDALTGLPNRVLLGERLEQAVQAADPERDAVALLLIDLDRFKEVNDTLGHHFGDLLLRSVASRLAGVVRDGGTVARLGGDEFAVLMPSVSGVAEAEALAGRLLHALQQPADLDGVTVDGDASIGVALYPVHSGDAHQLLQHADIAMYAAKRGCLGTSVYSPDGDDNGLRHLTLLGDLRRAIDRGELLLHYQPQIAAGTGQVCGMEALVRWQHPDHGLLMPEEFLPHAEHTGLIDRLTRFVLATALDQCQQWRVAGRPLPISVNIAERCLINTAFPGFVAGLLADRSLPAHLLTLEFPETIYHSGEPAVADALRQLADLGVRISIDDFGDSPGGGSPPVDLRALPVHELKIDPEYVGGAMASARDLGLRVVAEGVEDEQTWTDVQALGCDTGQGHWLGTPLPAGAVGGWLAGREITNLRETELIRLPQRSS